MSRSVAHLLRGVGTVRRKKNPAGDGQGGTVTTYVDHLTGQKCRRASPTATDLTVARKREAVISQVVYFAAGTDVQFDDRILVDGYVLTVEAAFEPSIPVYRKCLCSEGQHGERVS